MGITFSLMQKLKDHSVLSRSGLRVLDIGSSNLYQADAPGIVEYVRGFPGADARPRLDAFAERLARGSAYDPVKGGLNESFAGELIERCGMSYLSFDIAKGYKTEIFDLNRDDLPRPHRHAFDVVLNIGTTEHVLNQLNCFYVIHEATCPGGYMVHQLPVSGFTDHGYYVYTGRMFFDLATSNHYEIVGLWYEGPAGEDDLYQSVRSYASFFPALDSLNLRDAVRVSNWALTLVYRKTHDMPFVEALDTSTSVGEIPVRVGYAASVMVKLKAVVRNSRFLQRYPGILRLLRRLRGLRS